MKTESDLELATVGIPRILSDETGLVQASEGQCDCACVRSLAVSRQSAISLTDVPHSLSPDSLTRTVPIPPNHYAILGSRSRPVVLDRSAWTVANHFRQARMLYDTPQAWQNVDVQPLLEEMVALGLLVPENQVSLAPTEVLHTLSAWLHVTDRCNLRCDYCYSPHAGVDMPVETGRAAVDAVFRSALSYGFRQVKLKYAGGEPLLRFPLLVELHQHARTLSDQHGCALDGVVLSNGTLLTPEIVTEMQSLGLRLMISLDGLGDYQDRHRHFADGRGSFDAVAHAVDMTLSCGMIPDISITVSGRTAGGLAALMAWVLERDLPFSLNFYRENDLSSTRSDLRLEEGRIIRGMLAAYNVIESNLPRRSLLASLVDRSNLCTPHLRTCGVGQSYLVFDHSGRVAKCQMDIETTVTGIGDPDPLAAVRTSAAGICNPTVDEKHECRDCQWRYWCAGGCPMMAHRAAGRYDAKSPYCSIYRALYPEVIRLEGLRLLRYAKGP